MVIYRASTIRAFMSLNSQQHVNFTKAKDFAEKLKTLLIIFRRTGSQSVGLFCS